VALALAASALPAVTTACGPRVNAARVSPVRYAPVHPDSVFVFTSEARVHRPYEEVAILDGSMSSNGLDADMIRAMQKKAGELGANGLILGDIKHPSDKTVAATTIASAILKSPGSVDVPTRARATAIRMRDSVPR
jgi:hypothetical protein